MRVQGVVLALAIVERFDGVEELHSSRGARRKATAVDQFQFEGAPEAFDGSIAVIFALPAPGGHQAGLAEGSAKVGAGVLNAAVGVEEPIGWFEDSRQARHTSSTHYSVVLA